MNITLETVRQVLRNGLGRDSFIASFIKNVEDVNSCPTASIDKDGLMRYNGEFVNKCVTTEQDLFCLVVHEIMHPLFGHFVYSDGELENISADAVINGVISLVFAEASGGGILFSNLYPPTGLPGLLRPNSQMHDSRYGRLYGSLYGSGGQDLTTGEVITSLKVLTPSQKANIQLLGSHGTGGDKGGDSGLAGISSDVLADIALDLNKAAKSSCRRNAGYGDNLYDLFVEVLKSHLSLKKLLLQNFTTKQKVDRFRQSITRPAITTSPIPLHPSKRDLIMLSAGIAPFHYHNRVQRIATKEQGLAVYLDVSGSVNQFLPDIVGVLESLKSDLETVFVFSNEVVELPFKQLLSGRVKTTYGTDFNCIADSLIERGFDKAVVVTDGYASLDEGKQAELQRRQVRILTVLFSYKKDCPDFAPFGPVVQLEDVTQ